MAPLVCLYITTASQQEAVFIARSLLEKRLIACANIMNHVTSLYHWNGSLQESSEALLIAKTQKILMEQVIAAVKSLHSYDCPCVVALPIEGGNEAYFAWIVEETVLPDSLE